MRRALVWPALVFAPSLAVAQPVSLSSTVPALRITRTAVLPRGPGQALDDYCRGKVVEPEGAAARSVAARGWHLTGQARIGRLTAVSFVGGLMPGTSGICLVDGGNVGLFEGERLIAIVHLTRDDAGPLRRLTTTPTPRRLRLWSEEYTPPLADLVVRDGAIAVTPIAAEESWCGGIVLPNIYGLTIQAARRRLFARGWRPVPYPSDSGAPPQPGERDAVLRRQGVVETEICSGTGFGACLFDYRHPRGASLDVQTAGEEGTVVERLVTCSRRRRR